MSEHLIVPSQPQDFPHTEIPGSGETAQQVRRFAARTDALSSLPSMNMVESEIWLHSCPLTSIFVMQHMYKSVCNKIVLNIFELGDNLVIECSPGMC